MFPVPVEVWEKPFSLAVVAPQQGSGHGRIGASLQAGGLLASPAAAAVCCRVLIGTAENLALA